MASNRQQALHTGTFIDGFEIRKVLGVGSFGVTYQAVDSKAQRPVAIKEYCPHGIALRIPGGTSLRARDAGSKNAFNSGLQRFLYEARTLSRFQHPCIVHVHRLFAANGTAYLVMDFEHGQTLWGVLRHHSPLHEVAILALLIPILEGLRVVHGQSFLHRDIKPANILMRDNGAPVLLDFGAAREAPAPQSGELTAMFTPGYAPIEQTGKTDQQGPWTDLYALGATAYHCLTGQTPMAATERVTRLRSRQADDVTSHLQDASAGHYSSRLLKTVQWMMEPAAEHRPQNANQVLCKLQAAEAALSPGARAASVPWRPTTANFNASPALAHALLNTLQQHAGNVAHKVVPRAVSTAASYDELINLLAGYVLDPQSEIEFRERANELPARADEAVTSMQTGARTPRRQSRAPGGAPPK